MDGKGEERWGTRAPRRQELWELAFSRRRDRSGVNMATEGRMLGDVGRLDVRYHEKEGVTLQSCFVSSGRREYLLSGGEDSGRHWGERLLQAPVCMQDAWEL